jgi:hypothetical protein
MTGRNGSDRRERCESPVPDRVLSNGEFTAPGRTRGQRRVAEEIRRLGEHYGRRQGVGRRRFLASCCGMAAAFLAMNRVYGPLFRVDEAEAAEPEAAAERQASLSRQFIFDVQLHFVHNQYPWEGLLDLRRYARHWNPEISREELSIEKFKFDNFVKEVFLDSQTTLGLLSGAPSDDPQKWFLQNDEIARARAMINATAGSKRLFGHAVITPGQPGWLDEIDRAIEELRPDSWKGYTIGDPLQPSQYPWRLDDEDLVYPAYEKMVKAGIRNVCIHKGLLPEDYRGAFPDTWRYARVDDVPKAAGDWPELNFIIYHSALKPLQKLPEEHLAEFEKTGYIPWVTELARMPEEYGLHNLYAELGTCFATSAVTHPRHCATMLGTLIKGFGPEKVLWGTDSVWYGSPQWQIEAFRRLEIPEDLRERFGFEPLGEADRLVKNAVLGYNAARLYGVKLSSDGRAEEAESDRLAQARRRIEEDRRREGS